MGAHRLLRSNIDSLPRNDRNEGIDTVQPGRNNATPIARDVDQTVDSRLAGMGADRLPVASADRVLWPMNRLTCDRRPAVLRRGRSTSWVDVGFTRSPPRWTSSDIASTPPPPKQFHKARPR